MKAETSKWIRNVSPAGRPRTAERMGLFAVVNAIAEGLAFTSIDNPTGKPVTRNFSK